MRTCSTPRCKNEARKGRRFFHTCETRKKRARNPVRYCYQALKDNAKRRGKVFKLTFQQFEQFCYKTEYIRGKGRSSECFTIDRIDNSKGYTIDNIRVATKGDNSRKRTKTLVYDWEHPEYTVVL